MTKRAKNNTTSGAKRLSQKDKLLQLLHRSSGASLAEIAAAMKWQPHSARAMLTRLRKDGFTLVNEKVDGTSRYTITGEPAA